MPRRSLRDLYPTEVSQLAALLRRLHESSRLSQKDLAAELSYSEAAMSRYLSGQAVLPEEALAPFLRVTKASAEGSQLASRLLKTIYGPVQASTPPPEPLPGPTPVPVPADPPEPELPPDSTPAPPPPPQARARAPWWRRMRPRTLVAIAAALVLAYGLFQFVLVPTLLSPTPAPAATTCSKTSSPLPTAWSADCHGKSEFDRAKHQFTLTDTDKDGRSVVLQLKINGGEVIQRYNPKGFGKPPAVRSFPQIEAGTTVEFRTCTANRSAKHEADRRPRDCGDWVPVAGVTEQDR